MNPLVSVIVPVYNSRKSLRQCLVSILLQSYSNWECIVVDDGSDTSHEDLVNAFADSRFRFYRIQTNRGRGFARKYALEKCRGALIALQDADDWSMPDRLITLVKVLMQHKEVSFLSSGMYRCNAEGECLGVRMNHYIAAQYSKPPDKLEIGHGSLIIRRHVFEQCNYDPNIRCSEDHDFLLKALSRFKYINIADCLYIYNEENNQSAGKYLRSTLTRFSVLRNWIWKRPLRTAILGLRYATSCLAYTLAFIFGLEEKLFSRHWVEPSREERFKFEAAWERVKNFEGDDMQKKRAHGGP
jgi:glycosyltransferase involved in cell wall biosynthesis